MPIELIPDRQYERLDIAGCVGLSDGELAALKALGAVDVPVPMDAAGLRHVDSENRDRRPTVSEAVEPQPPTSGVDQGSRIDPGRLRRVTMVLIFTIVALALTVAAFVFLATR
jgi:hypothetical protein